MSSALYDISVLEDKYLVRVLDCGESVGDGYGGTPSHSVVQSVLEKNG